MTGTSPVSAAAPTEPRRPRRAAACQDCSRCPVARCGALADAQFLAASGILTAAPASTIQKGDHVTPAILHLGRFSAAALVSVLFVESFQTSAHADGVSLTPVAVSGQADPGGDGATFRSFDAPSLNDS